MPLSSEIVKNSMNAGFKPRDVKKSSMHHNKKGPTNKDASMAWGPAGVWWPKRLPKTRFLRS